MIPVDIAALAKAAIEDADRCRLAGVDAPDDNMVPACHVRAIANELKGRLGAGALRVAIEFWNTLEAEPGDTVH